jgi:hypothetical protein
MNEGRMCTQRRSGRANKRDCRTFILSHATVLDDFVCRSGRYSYARPPERTDYQKALGLLPSQWQRVRNFFIPFLR